MRMQRSLVQFLESYRAKGLAPTLGAICYRNRQCIVLESDLSSLGPPVNLMPDLNAVFREVFPLSFENLRLKYPLRSRHLKAVANLAQGYASFAVTRGGEVLGDMWYAGRAGSAATALHPDLAMLEIDPGNDGVYLWDTYVNEAERSTNVALSLLSLSLHTLREKGFSKAYGYVWADNRPAHFVYRIFKFNELKRITADRFVFLKRTRGPQNSSRDIRR
jgi:ribosomal protein S18 acetylase RimI-like enzyme